MALSQTRPACGVDPPNGRHMPYPPRLCATLVRCHMTMTNYATPAPLLACAPAPIRPCRLVIKRCRLAAASAAITLVAREQVPILSLNFYHSILKESKNRPLLFYISPAFPAPSIPRPVLSQPIYPTQESEASGPLHVAAVSDQVLVRFRTRPLLDHHHVHSRPPSFDARLQGLSATSIPSCLQLLTHIPAHAD